MSLKQMRKVLLVNLSTVSEKSHLSEYESKVIPIGLLYIASVIEKEHLVKVFCENTSKQNIFAFLKDFKPDYIAFSVNYSFQFPDAVQKARLIKETYQNITIIMGGSHITIMDKGYGLKEYPFIDFFVSGEGEYSLQKLLSGVHYSRIEGLAYRKDDKIIVNNNAVIPDLDVLPFPARHLIDHKKFYTHPFNYSDHRSTVIITSRGCPYSCINCNSSPYRARNPKKVIEEMTLLYAGGVRDLVVFDACFSLDMKRAEQLCDLMIEKRLNFSWSCETRVDRVNERLLYKMSKAGCKSIMFGLEASSNENLGHLNKQISIEQIKKAILLSRKYSIKTYGMFMLGLPFEGKNDIINTIEFSKSLNLNMAWFSIATPLPGTKLWEDSGYDSNNLEVLNKLSFYSGDVSFHDKNEIEALFFLAIRSFYFRPKIIIGQILDMLFHGSYMRRLHLFNVLVLQNPYVKNILGFKMLLSRKVL